MNDIANTVTCEKRAFGALDRFLRQQLAGQMAGLKHGRLVLDDACGTLELGEPAASHPDLQIHLEVLDADFYRAIAGNGSVGAGVKVTL